MKRSCSKPTLQSGLPRVRNAARRTGRRLLLGLGVAVVTCSAILGQAGPGGNRLRVPADYPTVAAAIAAAKDGDVVLVSPGVYAEALRLAGKTITLASLYLDSGDEAHIQQTVLDGRLRQPNGRQKTASAVITVEPDCGLDTRIVGFTIRNGEDGISCRARIHIEHNRFVNNGDAIDYEGGGGWCQHNVFENNRDDAVDLDGACGVVIAHNRMLASRDDGIEIRLHDYTGPDLEIVIRDNLILDSREDGIQIIDYPGRSARSIRIERNVIARSAMAAIGCMGNGRTEENYEAADVQEPIFVLNNTLVQNHYGITGGDALVAVNNLIVGTRRTALKKVDAGSVVAFALLWDNGQDNDGSNLQQDTVVRQDPQLGADWRLGPGSPAIDAGTATFQWQDRLVLRLAPDDYRGAAPDLGAFEFNPDARPGPAR